MATPLFKYQPMFPLGPDTTEYYLLTKDYVSVSEFEGKPILKVAPEGLTAMANTAFHDVSFMLRRSHNEQVAKILSDPEASDNDKYVALTFLRNAEVAAKGILPFCQDTGTAIIHGEKGQQVWTGFCDEEALSKGVYNTYTEDNLRYSQNAPLSMQEQLDSYFQKEARAKGKNVQAFETMSQQLDILFNNTPIKRQAELLLCLIDNIKEMSQQALQLTAYYNHQKLDAMYQLSQKKDGNRCDSYQSEEDALIKNRNNNWMKTIPSMIKENSSFIVVGALHLAGPDGLIAQLKKAGYTITAVK